MREGDRQETVADRYVELLKRSLMGLTVPDPHALAPAGNGDPRALSESSFTRRMEGRDWPLEGFTMIGGKRLDSLHACVEDVLANDVPGNFIETGVWRGGASIFMRALLAVHSVTDRVVYVADSFEGLPPPDSEQYPHDSGSTLHSIEALAVSLEEVKWNFSRFGLLDAQVQFVKGWFRDTLPLLSDETWALIRLDGDLYESTVVGLESLYPGLSPGGYVVIDDYLLPMCRQAVHDYRKRHGITEPIVRVDKTGVYWRKAG